MKLRFFVLLSIMVLGGYGMASAQLQSLSLDHTDGLIVFEEHLLDSRRDADFDAIFARVIETHLVELGSLNLPRSRSFPLDRF